MTQLHVSVCSLKSS